jgi:MEMO1 family protein
MVKSIFIVGTVILLTNYWACSSSQTQQAKNMKDRKPCVAGTFYPSNTDTLKTTLERLFNKTEKQSSSPVAAVIVPHAGYVYSGEVAANAYRQIDPEQEFENIFLIGSSHRVSFDGASVYNAGDFISPLGKASVNIPLANSLIQANPCLSFYEPAHTDEHTLEVQLPFLQFHLKKPFKIVPIVIGTYSAPVLERIAATLKPHFNAKNLFVFSTDFSHYPNYKNACIADENTAKAIITNQAKKLIAALADNERKHYANLQTSLCGETSVLTLLYMTENMPSIEYKIIKYQNSGDVSGDFNRVVGYYAITVERKPKLENGQLTEADKKELLGLARKTIEQYLAKQTVYKPDSSKFSPALTEKCGCFVTLRANGELRGCIGRFTTDGPLYKLVQEMAMASATQDHRFDAVKLAELSKIKIEISVLSPMRKVNSADEIILGKHGIYMKKGYNHGTFLPKVATEQAWTKEQFLGYCAREKAGIGWDGWKTAELYIYEAFDFEEE